MKIIIEYVLIENFFINIFILSTCELFIKERAKLKILNSLFGSIIALVFPLFNLTNLGTILLKILVGSVMICVSFSFKTYKKFFYTYFSFILMTFVFGGATSLLTQSFGTTNLFYITIFAGLVYCFTVGFFRHHNKRKIIQNFKYIVRLHFNGKQVDEQAYFDTGNILYDSITNRPIILITPKVFEKITGQNYYEFILKNNDPSLILKNCHYVPASTSLSQGKMLVFELDKLQILHKNNEIKEFDSIFVGLSFANFEKAFDSELLLHSSLI